MAASLGGLRAFETISQRLPRDFPLPIVFVQHLSDRYPTYLVDLLSETAALRVRWLRNGDLLERGVIHIAPPGLHTMIDHEGRASSWYAPRINHARPAADVLFSSAAEAVGAGTIAVVLTGRLFDGAAGALHVRRAGGVVIAQDPATCPAPGMPRATIEAGAAHFVLAPNDIASALVALALAQAREHSSAGTAWHNDPPRRDTPTRRGALLVADDVGNAIRRVR